MKAAPPLPRWADLLLLPAVCLALALLAAAAVIALTGQRPLQVFSVLLHGAWGTPRGIGHTLYYATSFVFTGLAVAVAFHAGLFNIGGEGQAILGGLGAALVALRWSDTLPAAPMLALMLAASCLAGMAWAALPGWLQARRGSHVVITTIMFNFIASSLLVYLLVNQLRPAGSMAVESAAFAPSARLATMAQLLAAVGVHWPATPLNASALLALAAALAVYLFLWRTRAGLHLRTVGASPLAAQYAGICARRQIVRAMCISGALAGMVGMNEIAGVHGRLVLEFVGGAGFTGIAVALMGRNHPLGIVCASLLFGSLFQGGAEVAFDVPGFSRDMVVLVQGLIVLFSGAMVYVIAPWVARALALAAQLRARLQARAAGLRSGGGNAR